MTTTPPVHRVTMRKMLEVIHRGYPEAGNITIRQRFDPRAGWINCEDFTPLREAIRYHETGFEAVSLRLIDRFGAVRYPDYRLEEFLDVFKWEVRDHLLIHVNQGERDAYVLAVVGDEALIEYEMPAGTTALWIIDANNPSPGCKRNVSYKSCPKKWLEAMEEAGTVWENNPQ
jgi:hypothetical protein